MTETKIDLDDIFYDDIYLYSSSIASGGYDIPLVNFGAKYKRNFFKYNYGKLPAIITASYYANKLKLKNDTTNQFNQQVDYVFQSLQNNKKVPTNFKLGNVEYPVSKAIPDGDQTATVNTLQQMNKLYNEQDNNKCCCNSKDLEKTSSIPLDYFSPLYGIVDYDDSGKITRIIITHFAKKQISDGGSGEENYSDPSKIQLELMKKGIKTKNNRLFTSEDLIL